MNWIVAFILGLFVGWLVEWGIDWYYWRRKNRSVQHQDQESCRSRVAELEREIVSYQSQLASLQSASTTTPEPALPTSTVEPPKRSHTVAMEPVQVRDRLEDIQGISPEMALRLNESGVYTFMDLAAMRPQQLREISADLLQPGSEIEMIKQARLKAGTIQKVDDLEVIVGIGPVIAQLLNQAGIFTFAELGSLTASELRDIVGDRIQKLANEEKILTQARQLAEHQA